MIAKRNSLPTEENAAGSRTGWLSRAVLLEPGELPALLAAFSYFFFLLCSYYILRPVRDEMGVRGGVENLQWLFTATFIVMLLAVPLFAGLASRFRRSRLIPLSYGFFIACIVGFWFWLESDRSLIWAARTFFVWLSVFNLFVVSVFWSLMADLFNHRQAARLFGVIAAGGSAGAILGPALTGILAQQVAPRHLLPLAALLLALTLPCLAILLRWKRRQGARRSPGQDEPPPLGGSLLEGVQAVFSSPYLLGICAFIWLFTTLSTFLYFGQAEIVSNTFSDSGQRTALFAALDFATNLLTIVLQLFVTARLVTRFGLQRSLALVPVLVALGFLVLALSPALITVGLFQVVRRAGNYAITKPGREMLFTVLPRMEKYKSKNFIDTVIYRGGDAIAGWFYTLLGMLGLGLAGISLLAVPLATLWAVIGYRLGLAQRHYIQQQDAEVPNETPRTA